MENPNNFPANQPQNTVTTQAQQTRGNTDARGGKVRPQFHIPDPNYPPVLYACAQCQKAFKSGKALDGHLRIHRYRSWKGRRYPPPNVVISFDLNETTMNEEARTQAQQTRGNTDARGGKVRPQFHIPDPNYPPVLYECPKYQTPFKSGKALDGHLSKHRYRSWVRRYPPPNVVISFNLNETPMNEDM